MKESTGRAVRWKQGTRWHYGHVAEIERDGSLRIHEDHNDAARSLRAEALQELVRGKRGGRSWAPVEEIDLVFLSGEEARQDGW